LKKSIEIWLKVILVQREVSLKQRVSRERLKSMTMKLSKMREEEEEEVVLLKRS
jgi:hypothetical protein